MVLFPEYKIKQPQNRYGNSERRNPSNNRVKGGLIQRHLDRGGQNLSVVFYMFIKENNGRQYLTTVFVLFSPDIQDVLQHSKNGFTSFHSRLYTKLFCFKCNRFQWGVQQLFK